MKMSSKSGFPSLVSILPSYAPLPSFSSIIDFYGDSFVQGAGGVPGADKWSSLLSAYFSKTENNQGVGGTLIADMAKNMVNTRSITSTNHCFIMSGWNDLVNNPSVQYDSIFRCLKAAILYACLPNKVDPRPNVSPFTHSPDWGTIGGYVGGVCTVSVNGHCDGTFTGRWLAVSMYASYQASPTNCPNMSFTVDGTVVTTAQPIYNNYSSGATPVAQMMWIYDTGVSGIGQSHTVTITYASNTGTWTNGAFVLWGTGFDYNPVGATPVYVMSVPYQCTYTGGQTGQVNYNTFNDSMHKTVLKLRQDYGLPVYFIDTGVLEQYGHKVPDMIHPNISGHSYIFNRVLTFLQEGEY